jgi:hypothetical protein
VRRFHNKLILISGQMWPTLPRPIRTVTSRVASRFNVVRPDIRQKHGIAHRIRPRGKKTWRLLASAGFGIFRRRNPLSAIPRRRRESPDQRAAGDPCPRSSTCEGETGPPPAKSLIRNSATKEKAPPGSLFQCWIAGSYLFSTGEQWVEADFQVPESFTQVSLQMTVRARCLPPISAS